MSEEKEMTAPNVSIGVDTEQSSIKQTTNSISNRDVNFNPFDEFFKKIDPSYMKTVTMQELYQDIYSKKPPVIEGLLYQGTYLFVGSPKIGKSFFMAQLAYHVSTGTPLWDYPVKKGTVLYLALEDDYRRLQERMYRMFGTETTPDLFFSVASKSLNEGLLDQTVGLIGFGAVARWTARLLSAFGAQIFISADHVTPDEAASYGARKATIDEIMSGCKIVSVHLARTPQTYHIIDERQLKRLQDGAVFINTARGSIVDEAALARELATGRFKAALDVYEVEPLPMDSPLRTLDNVLLMPHMGGPTMDRRPFVTRALLDELPRVLAGETSSLTITRDMMRRMTR